MKRLIVECKTPPVVEIDTDADAAYVRFSEMAVTRTIPVDTEGVFVAMDLDESGSLVGIEVIGAKEFGVAELVKLAPVDLSKREMLLQTRYVSAPNAPVSAH